MKTFKLLLSNEAPIPLEWHVVKEQSGMSDSTLLTWTCFQRWRP